MNHIYIASQKRDYDLPKHLDKDNTIWFPESHMTTHDMLYSGRPDGWNVVTDCHFLVSLYPSEDVFYYDKENKEWVNPEFQTYGASYNLILSELWDHHDTIPIAVIGGQQITNVMGFGVK